MRYFLAASLLVSVVGITGCEPKPAAKDDHAHSHDGHSHGDHSHGDHSHGEAEKVTYESPAAELNAILGKAIAASEAIADATSKGNPDDAHDQLHDIGHYLESLPELGKKASVDAEFQSELESSSKSLFDAISKIDETLHDSSKELKYDDVKDAITGGIEKLKELAAKAPK